MRNRRAMTRYLAMLGLIATVGMLAGCPMEAPSAGEPHALTGKQAPEFELERLNGESFALADELGENVIILDFWATWCGPCVRAMPILQDISEQYADQGVKVYGVNLRESNNEVQAFFDEHDLSLNILMDRSGSVAQQYEANAIPQTVIIDRNGNVAAVHVGFSPNLGEELSAELDALLAEPAEQPEEGAI